MVSDVIILGLPGHHNFAGLSPGNLHSEAHEGSKSYPKEAALQVLDLAESLINDGKDVIIMPPQMRPDTTQLYNLLVKDAEEADDEEALEKLKTIYNMGDTWEADYATIEYAGNVDGKGPKDEELAGQAVQRLKQTTSSAAMWAANAATVTQGTDTKDGKTHITIANLNEFLHRSLEAEQTHFFFKELFKGVKDVKIHEPLNGEKFPDEGAANHVRLAPSHDHKGLHIFFYGKDDADPSKPRPKEKAARQSLQTCQEIAHRHQIPDDQVVFIHQNPDVIDAGIFHNDVISVGQRGVYLYHEDAFAEGEKALKEIEGAYQRLHGESPIMVPVTREELSVAQAADSYLFNSQLIDLPDGSIKIVAHEEAKPKELTRGASKEEKDAYDKALACYKAQEAAKPLIEKIIAGNSPISAVEYVNVQQSLHNGGGPACLRLRVPLTEAQVDQLRDKQQIMSLEWINQLRDIVNDSYPDEIKPEDLASRELYIRAVHRTNAMSGFFETDFAGFMAVTEEAEVSEHYLQLELENKS